MHRDQFESGFTKEVELKNSTADFLSGIAGAFKREGHCLFSLFPGRWEWPLALVKAGGRTICYRSWKWKI